MRLRTLGGALALTALLLGCSGDDAMSGGDDMSAADTDGVAEEAAEAPQEDRGEGAAGDAAGTSVTAASRSAQRLIRTAELTLEVQDTARALDEVVATAERAGGFTATTDLQRDLDGVVRGTLTLRVPSASLDEVVDELEAIGEAVPVNRIDERDVTVESADLRARIDNLTAYESELRGLLASAREEGGRTEDLLAIFERIRGVREEIDVLQGRLDLIDEQVALSTVRVTLRPLASPAGLGNVSWAPGETFRDALAATGRALAGIGDAAIRLVVTALPVTVVVLLLPAILLYVLVRWARTRRPRRAPTGGVPPASPLPGQPERDTNPGNGGSTGGAKTDPPRSAPAD